MRCTAYGCRYASTYSGQYICPECTARIEEFKERKALERKMREERHKKLMAFYQTVIDWFKSHIKQATNKAYLMTDNGDMKELRSLLSPEDPPPDWLRLPTPDQDRV